VTQTPVDLRALHSVRKGRVEFVDVPALNYLMLEGTGDTDSPAFAAAIRVLYSVSYAAQFLARRAGAAAQPVMPIEALWWVDDPACGDLLATVALGVADLGPLGRGAWKWRAMISQPEPVDESVVHRAIAHAARREIPEFDRVQFERWEEGRAAQILHVGPYTRERATIAALHDAIDEVGLRPRGRHHQIYLTDPQRTAPSRLRTLLRQPVG
jgi:hypothetical protein